MKSTPLHGNLNAELLELMPTDARRVVDVGCMAGTLAQAYLQRNPGCDYIGIELDADYAELAGRHCRRVIVGNIEHLADAEFRTLLPADCWAMGDVLEHLYDPWRLLRTIRASAGPGSCIVACVPNAQHWSVQQRLCSGLFRYEAEGLLDRTHIRWFTRVTLWELFESCGFQVAASTMKIHPEPMPERLELGLRRFAKSVGADPDQAIRDATPYQWVVKAVPA